jgi:hypothetical protein
MSAAQICTVFDFCPMRGRPTLTAPEVLAIFAFRDDPCCNASNIGRRFGIGDKAVRDIWRGRTWKKVTNCLQNGQSKSVGRPSGVKDIRKRAPRRDRLEVLRFGPIDEQLFVWARTRFVFPHLFVNDGINGLEPE